MRLIGDDIEEQIHQVFRNLLAVVKAAGGTADQIMQLRIYLTDLKHFALVNTIMAEYIGQPYPARAAIQVSALPKNAQIEVEGTAVFWFSAVINQTKQQPKYRASEYLSSTALSP